MPNPNPSPSTRFTPLGDEKLLFRRFGLRPDQVERLALEPNQSATVRNALDMWFSIHPPHIGTDEYDYAAIDAAFAEDEQTVPAGCIETNTINSTARATKPSH